jgi:hypothetical protein
VKSREEVARFIECQMETAHEQTDKHRRTHYGYQDARRLLDFIYDGEPTTDAERLVNTQPLKGYQ